MIYVLTNERLSIETDKVKYVESMDFVLGWLEVHEPKVLTIDTETTGLDFLDDKVIMFQMGNLEDQIIIDTRYYDVEPLREMLESKEVLKILQNASFDYKMLRSNFDITMENVFDTMLVDKVINCGKGWRSNLQALAQRYLDKYIEKDIRLDFVGGFSGPYMDYHLLYGSEDIITPYQIYLKQLDILKRENLEKIASLENKAVLAFADIEYNGIGLNEEKWLERAKLTKTSLDELKTKLDSVIELDPLYKKYQETGDQLDMFSPDDYSFVKVNWDSPKQVLEILQEENPELDSVGADVLFTVENKSQMIKDYMAYKKVSKLYGSYGPSFLKHLKSDGKIHTSFGQILNTGRVSSSSPNMQQIPADNSFRNCFTSGDPDWSFVSSDYSSQELCVIATLAKDPVWLKALQQGKDLHSVCAALVFGHRWEVAADNDCAFYEEDENGTPKMKKCDCKAHKSLRNGVKAINFGLAYGMSEYALSDRMQISVQEARDLIKTYFETFPKIRQALETFGEFGKKYGFIMTMPPFKRKRFFPTHKFIGTDNSVSGTIERASKNTPIQGSSADITKLAMVYVRNYINLNKVPVKMVMTVHDQIDTIVHKDYAEVWKKKLTEIMERAALKIVTNGLLKAETEVSPVWKK